MNYWLAPNGRVWGEEQIGSHYKRALEIIDDKYPEMLDGNGMFPYKIDAVEFLESKGFIRYMDWSNSPRWIIYNQKPTSRQKEMMFSLTKFLYE